MGLQNFMKRFAEEPGARDSKALREFCENHPSGSIGDLTPRQNAVVVGEISAIRIVPREGSPWLQATLTDGMQSLTLIWTGRSRIGGITPGRRLVAIGRAVAPRPGSSRLVMYNPDYELIAA